MSSDPDSVARLQQRVRRLRRWFYVCLPVLTCSTVINLELFGLQVWQWLLHEIWGRSAAKVELAAWKLMFGPPFFIFSLLACLAFHFRCRRLEAELEQLGVTTRRPVRLAP